MLNKKTTILVLTIVGLIAIIARPKIRYVPSGTAQVQEVDTSYNANDGEVEISLKTPVNQEQLVIGISKDGVDVGSAYACQNFVHTGKLKLYIDNSSEQKNAIALYSEKLQGKFSITEKGQLLRSKANNAFEELCSFASFNLPQSKLKELVNSNQELQIKTINDGQNKKLVNKLKISFPKSLDGEVLITAGSVDKKLNHHDKIAEQDLTILRYLAKREKIPNAQKYKIILSSSDAAISKLPAESSIQSIQTAAPVGTISAQAISNNPAPLKSTTAANAAATSNTTQLTLTTPAATVKATTIATVNSNSQPTITRTPYKNQTPSKTTNPVTTKGPTAVPTPSHKECAFREIENPTTKKKELTALCEAVAGRGKDQCSEDKECAHKECGTEKADLGQCLLFEGKGEDQCTENKECGHKECKMGVCAYDPTPGEDKCKVDTECSHTECSSEDFTCQIIKEPGENKCSTDADCGHKECSDSGFCKQVNGQAPDKCQSDTQCGYKSCDARGLCRQFGGTGTSTCNSDTQCGYKACDAKGYCKQVSGSGTDKCSSDTECGHRDCVSGYCTHVPGAGEDQCDYSDDCGHKACDSAGYCSQVPGIGEDQCTSDEECGHLKCQTDSSGYTACLNAAGEGPDECSTIEDCTHKECQSGSCLALAGEGADKCSEDKECGHKECREEFCTQVEGAGQDQCNTQEDCGHKECTEGSCWTKAGKGVDQCQYNYQCGHKACQGSYCSYVPGAGQPNECNEDADCGHRECRAGSGYCNPVPGAGPDRCSSHFDCGHLACDPSGNGTCIMTAGKGSNTCEQHSDCPRNTQQSQTKVSSLPAALPISKATVKVTFFQDLKCGMCKFGFLDGIRLLALRNSGQVAIEFKEFPLIARNEEMTLALASKCAREQGKQLALLTSFYEDIKYTSADNYMSQAAKAGLSAEALKRCVDSKRYLNEIEEDRSEAKALGIRGTPSYLINGKLSMGALTYEALMQKITEEQ